MVQTLQDRRPCLHRAGAGKQYLDGYVVGRGDVQSKERALVLRLDFGSSEGE